ncbi:MAG TPA: AI-2E family transporter [Gemmatimonadales bacterium]|nr:AI-2E family transporter [Gemmatimonadales bacterium]
MPRRGAPTRDSGPRGVTWSSRDVLRVCGIVAGVYLALQLLWVGRSVFFITFLAVLFGLCISTGVDYLTRWRIPRGAGAALIVLAVLGVIVGLGAIAAPRMTAQLSDLQAQLPAAVGRVEQWVGTRYGGLVAAFEHRAPNTPGAAQPSRPPPEAAASVRRTLTQQAAGLADNFFAVFSSTLAVLASLVLIIMVSVYVAADPELYHKGLMHLFPHHMRPRAGEVLSEVATLLRRWLVTQLVAMLVIGSVTTVVLLLLHVRAAIGLGIIAGLLEFIPYVGPILSAVPAVAMGFLSSPETALYVVLAYIAIQQSEGHLLIPLLMKRGLDLPPVVTIVAQTTMGLLFGFLGLLVAMPLVGAAMVLIKMLYVQDVVGDEVTLPGDAAEAPG